MKSTLLLALAFASLLLASCASKPDYEEGKFIIWSGRGVIMTASATGPAADWLISKDPPINERVVVARKSPTSSDRLLQAPDLDPAGAHKPNFLTEDEVSALQDKATRAESEQNLEIAARYWEYLAADRPDNATFSFNACKAWARLGAIPSAIRAAREAWGRGFDDLASFQTNPAFAKAGEDRAWQSMLIEFEVRAARAKD